MEHPARVADPDFFPEGARVGVVTDSGLDRLLDYVAPAGGVASGALVAVPLGPRRVLGCIWGPPEGAVPAERLKPVAAVLPVPPLPAPLRAFLARASDYTLTPLTAMLRLATRAPGLGTPPPERRLVPRRPSSPGRPESAAPS